MKTKFVLLLIIALLAVSLTACNTATRSAVDNESAELPSDQTNEVSEPSVNDISDESADTEPQDTENSDQTDETPSATEPNESNTLSQNTEPANKTDTPQGNNQSVQSQSPQPSQPNNPQTPSNPPTTSQPPTTTPPRTEPTTPSEPPVTPEPPKQLPPEGVMYSDFDDDEHGILKAVHDYAVSKGFVPDDTLDINAGYRGRPNLDDLSASQVKDTLIYHVDRIFNLYGPAHFRVVFWNYQGKIEYIFLWR